MSFSTRLQQAWLAPQTVRASVLDSHWNNSPRGEWEPRPGWKGRTKVSVACVLRNGSMFLTELPRDTLGHKVPGIYNCLKFIDREQEYSTACHPVTLVSSATGLCSGHSWKPATIAAFFSPRIQKSPRVRTVHLAFHKESPRCQGFYGTPFYDKKA